MGILSTDVSALLIGRHWWSNDFKDDPSFYLEFSWFFEFTAHIQLPWQCILGKYVFPLKWIIDRELLSTHLYSMTSRGLLFSVVSQQQVGGKSLWANNISMCLSSSQVQINICRYVVVSWTKQIYTSIYMQAIPKLLTRGIHRNFPRGGDIILMTSISMPTWKGPEVLQK